MTVHDSPQRPRTAWICLFVLGVLHAAVAAADTLLEDELGRWLDQEVAPPLAEALSRHPRFQGETVRITTLTPSAAPGTSNQLARAIEARLRQRLLGVDGVRLAVDQPRRGCAPPPDVGYLVRVELTAGDSRNARVHVAMVDVAESVWVSGISHQWQGRLTAAERSALATPVSQGAPGSAGSPIPLDRAEDVARAMKSELACLLPRDLDGAVFVATPEARPLARVSLALASELRYEPLAVLTADPDQAQWLLTLNAQGAGADVRELAAILSDADGGRAQQVGSVFVSGVPGDATVPGSVAAPPVAEAAVRTAGQGAPSLLSPLILEPARREGICDDRKARVNSCVEVAFELREPAYLFVLSTRDHLIVESPCGDLSGRADAGSRRFRLRVAPGRYAVDGSDTGPDAGFYVLAVRERTLARQLQTTLAAATGHCGGGAADQHWLEDLARILDAHGDAVAWRAIHLVHDSTGIAAL